MVFSDIHMIKGAKKRRVCFVITSFIHYSRNLLILDELKRRPDVDLHIIIGGTALLSKYSSRYAHVKEMLIADGFKNIYEVYFNLEGDNSTIKAKTAGLGIVEFSSLFNNIEPDIIVVRGDRFECLSAATAAAYMNIPIAHLEGGDRSGTIDESVRHSITKLSHFHFATNDEAKKRLLRMGEDPKFVFYYGSPDIEVVAKLAKKKINGVDLEKTGSGAVLDLKGDFLMVMYHPVWKDVDSLRKLSENTRILLETVHKLNMPTLWWWPNFDVGAEEISHELRAFKDSVSNHKIRFMRYLPPRIFLALLDKTRCLIGNSSSGIKECSYLGVPVVNIGYRQHKRLKAENVLDVEHDKNAIKRAIAKQISIGRYPSSNLYYKKDTAKNIARTIAVAPLYVQKSFVD